MPLKQLIIVVSAFLLVMGVGCQNGGCIAVDGDYQGFSGGIEYCFDGARSAQLKIPVFRGPDGEVIFGFSTPKIKKINRILETKSPTEIKFESNSGDNKENTTINPYTADTYACFLLLFQLENSDLSLGLTDELEKEKK